MAECTTHTVQVVLMEAIERANHGHEFCHGMGKACLSVSVIMIAVEYAFRVWATCVDFPPRWLHYIPRFQDQMADLGDDPSVGVRYTLP